MASAGCDAGFFSRLFSGNAIVCSDAYKSYLAGQDAQQIISDAEYAKSNYQGNQVVQNIWNDVESSAETTATADVNGITNSLAKDATTCSGGLDFTWVGGGCVDTDAIKKWLIIGGVVAGAIFFFVYVAPVLSLFKRR